MYFLSSELHLQVLSYDGLIGDKVVVNGIIKEMEDSKLDLMLAGSESEIFMIEVTSLSSFIYLISSNFRCLKQINLVLNHSDTSILFLWTLTICRVIVTFFLKRNWFKHHWPKPQLHHYCSKQTDGQSK